jgi:molybdopterin/thiamine biosynthesis adenylyltransferase
MGLLEKFDYLRAFSRNIGFVTEAEQLRLKGKTVAIAGMGGVGGAHLLTLTRMGVGGFHVADFDRFDIENFNRQVGATTHTVGRLKVDVMAEMAIAINPEVRIHRYPEGVLEGGVDDFLEGVDLYVDGLDFFCQDMRARVFRRCAELGIPAVTAAPIGLGTSCLVFTKDSMSFDDYFGIEGQPYEEQLVRFAVGLMPRMLHGESLVDPSRIDVRARKMSSSPVGIQAASAAAATESLKLLLGRGRIYPVPYCHQYDPYSMRSIRTCVIGGHRNPLTRLRTALLRRSVQRNKPQIAIQSDLTQAIETPTSALEQILETARWAPSGDNSQPWRFEPTGEHSVRVHLQDQSAHDVYDFDGRPTLLSGGMLLETMRLAASREGRGLELECTRIEGDRCQIDVSFPVQHDIGSDPLVDFVHARSVDRRPYQLAKLTEPQRCELEATLGDGLEIRWLTTFEERLRFARINATCSAVRLRLPEANAVHERVLNFRHCSSVEGIPIGALGLSAPMRRAVRLGIEHPEIASFVTRMIGTGGPSLEFDILPGLFCSAHFFITSKKRMNRDHASTAIELLRAGMRLQRFWLRATSLGLALQPSVAPLSFAFHTEHGHSFAHARGCDDGARQLLEELRALSGCDSEHFVFAGRVGVPQVKAPSARSLRRPLSELLMPLRTTSAAIDPVWAADCAE